MTGVGMGPPVSVPMFLSEGYQLLRRLATGAVMVLILAVNGYWVVAALYTFGLVNLAFLLYSKVIKPASVKRQPPAITPDTPD
jgi:hypothetical protein